MKRATLALLTVLALGTGCKYVQAPSEPSFAGLRSLKMPPGEPGAPVPVVLRLAVENPNDHAMALEGDGLTLVDTERGEPIGTVEIPGGSVRLAPKAEAEVSEVEVKVALDRSRWRRDLLARIREGGLRVQGELRVRYRGHTYDIDLDQPIEDDGSGGGELASPVVFEAPSFVRLVLASASEVEMRVDVVAENRLGQDFEVRQLEISVGAPSSSAPLVVRVDRRVMLEKGARVPLSLEGVLDLERCDPTLLDDIEAEGRRVRVSLAGEGRGRFPPLDLDPVAFELALPAPGASDGGRLEVGIRSRGLYELAISPQDMFGIAGAFTSIGTLLSTGALDAPMKVRNPLPGTLRHEAAKITLVRDRTVLAEAELRGRATMPPRQVTELPVRVRLEPAGREAGMSLARDIFGGRFELPPNTRVRYQWVAHVPVFGEIEQRTDDYGAPEDAPRP